MKIFRSNGEYDMDLTGPSVFLAGPTPRSYNKTPELEWRGDAVQVFQDMKFNGTLYLPTPMRSSYTEQVNWEVYHLERADCIMFWVPRQLDVMPAFTTNIEFGEWMRSGKVVLGFPIGAPKMRYMEYRAKKYNVPVLSTFNDTISAAIELATGGPGLKR